VKVRFLAEAEQELDEAVAYYNVQRAGLGREFAAAVKVGVSRIEQHPNCWHRLTPNVRRYQLVRQPGYWMGRVR
jgi:toxin ParE2